MTVVADGARRMCQLITGQRNEDGFEDVVRQQAH